MSSPRSPLRGGVGGGTEGEYPRRPRSGRSIRRFFAWVATVLATVLLLALLWASLTAEVRAARLSPLPPPSARVVDPRWPVAVRGALHVHSTASDGHGSIEQIAQRSARAGLGFVAITDHQTRAAVPQPMYRGNVLILPGEELSTDHGHLLHYGIRHRAGSSRRADEALQGIRMAGGLAVAAHPTRRSRPWRPLEPHESPLDGLEVLNLADLWMNPRGPSGRLRQARALFLGLFEPELALLELRASPTEALSRWDLPGPAHRPPVGVLGSDAHGHRWGPIGPGYDAPFSVASNHLLLAEPLTGEPQADAGTLFSALAAGRLFLAWDRLGDPTGFRFWAETGPHHEPVPMGGTVDLRGWTLRAELPQRLPGSCELVLYRNGASIHKTSASLHWPVQEEGSYRVEVRFAAGAGGDPAWIYSNPILVRPTL